MIVTKQFKLLVAMTAALALGLVSVSCGSKGSKKDPAPNVSEGFAADQTPKQDNPGQDKGGEEEEDTEAKYRDPSQTDCDSPKQGKTGKGGKSGKGDCDKGGKDGTPGQTPGQSGPGQHGKYVYQTPQQAGCHKWEYNCEPTQRPGQTPGQHHQGHKWKWKKHPKNDLETVILECNSSYDATFQDPTICDVKSELADLVDDSCYSEEDGFYFDIVDGKIYVWNGCNLSIELVDRRDSYRD